ncbi:MAG: SDR family oxidoreductase [Salinisphaera sp.]|jgi:uncharacterized protein YbjT (DUF2867 family)|nr:SDR family oxidoreductase [Salinisphaera sp.]
MKILVAGAHGQIGQRLIKAIADSDHSSIAMIRNAGQAPEMTALGAHETVVADLEDDCSDALAGVDVVIFTAGSGAHTPPEKTDAVDRDGAISLIDQSVRHGVRRFLLVSSMNADTPENGPEAMQHYFAAKKAADDRLKASGMDYTVLRPGKLTDDTGTGKVALAERLGRSGDVTRDDVASVLLALVDAPAAFNQQLELLSGDTPIADAVEAL